MFAIAPAAPADVPAVATVLAAAFLNDTVMGTLVQGENRQARLAGLFRGLLRTGAIRTGHVDLARRHSDGAVLGAAIWETPGQHASLLAQARDLPTFVRALGWRGVPAAARLQATLAAHRPAEPHWYLAQIGVSAAARGSGVGSALLTSRLGQIDATGMPVYLESSNERNRALYLRHGFSTIAILTDLPHARPAAMWRVSPTR